VLRSFTRVLFDRLQDSTFAEVSIQLDGSMAFDICHSDLFVLSQRHSCQFIIQSVVQIISSKC
jgi:hypothetical protein